ncbi:MAG: hypothetical protein ACRBB0_26885 [Pelagimonas sp.]|uniref:hypothetical protein n=1 Tax=Pelagimonas sp. TaxID=2073170 RepID=UPI003D6B4E51
MQTCRQRDGLEVCAWLEHFELRRFYPKQLNSELSKGIYLIEGRSVRTAEGSSVSFSFEWSGPQNMLSDDVVKTHPALFRSLEVELEKFGIGEQNRIGFASSEDYFAFLDFEPHETNQDLARLVTCIGTGTGMGSGRNLVLEYPSLDAMLQCLTDN